ncbi:hypothetical protein SAMN05444274_107146 [Mariniphaga anaerophila]|uniref:WD40-like Beta Propeller Repeat n=1 Tax=Mariniphaga anaerophila TaxID=1484053 RepID=A0A1M5DLG7_9BACT|nr:hypothetical protein [Mariniphaga anaerophila]SHF67612.1 hypothetical protein SAMN05444274_107146 [Mariniphaga anaerophila]
MKRRDFLRTSAGFVAVAAAPGVFLVQCKSSPAVKIKFRDYQKDTSLGKVKIVTPDDGFYLNTFYDICPFSPSQKLLAVNKLPYQGKTAEYGDLCDICIVDLENETIETVYSTKGWGYQLGANLNWGITDRYLYTNDIIDNDAVCVRIDLDTKEVKAFAGPMYHIAPDESAVAGFPLDLINGYQDGESAQMGYGVPIYKLLEELKGAPSTEGLWRTDLKTNEKTLLVSLKAAYEAIDNPYYADANCYFFHTKYNKQGTRMLQVFRGVFPGSSRYHPTLLTFNPDGSDIGVAVTQQQWARRGNHPNWHPDGKRIVMNLTPTWLGEEQMRFCIFDYSGDNFKLLSKKHFGSGHPSVTPDTSYLISDYYVGEYKKLGYDGSPIRLIDLNTDEEQAICTVFTDLDIDASTFRVDPHPAWSRDYKKVCFNGAPNGIRQVFVADLEGVI